jgi:phosphoadenosine phosphosulfate reductase
VSAIDLYAKPSAGFAGKVHASLVMLTKAEANHSPITQASSLGAEDMVVTHLLHTLKSKAEVFVLDTGKLHGQTLSLIERIEARYRRTVQVYRPNPDDAKALEAEHGPELMYQSIELRKACCDLRKMKPLARALEGKGGWITGLRREQSNARAHVPDLEIVDQRAKINPLAEWTWGDVWHYIAQNDIPYNELHDQFFPSIGCAPCTRAIAVGEDFRSGRWWWEDQGAKECGLHVAPVSKVIPLQAIG